MPSPATETSVLCCADTGAVAVGRLLNRHGIAVGWVAPDSPITGSFWGEPEAGIVEQRIFVPQRRESLDGNAGADDLEESAVCYLQIVLADYLPGVGRQRLMQDMDTWGYSFRHGATERWFEKDADDARA
jgi:hypothetical protein